MEQAFDRQRLEYLAGSEESRAHSIEWLAKELEEHYLARPTDLYDLAEHDPSSLVRWEACNLLRRLVDLDHCSAIPQELEGALLRVARHDDDADVREVAVDALGRVRPSRRMCDELLRVAREDVDRAACLAIDALSKTAAYLRHPAVVRLLHELIRDPRDSRASDAAVTALGRVGDREAFQALVNVVRCDEYEDETRLAALGGLCDVARAGSVPEEELVPALIEMVRDPELEFWRPELFRALGDCCQSPEARDELARVAAAVAAPAAHREAAAAALRDPWQLANLMRSEDRDTPALALASLRTVALERPDVRRMCVVSLMDLLSRQDAQASDREAALRCLAIESLGALRDPRATDALAKVALSPEESDASRGEALVALQRIGGPEAWRAIEAVKSVPRIGYVACALSQQSRAEARVPAALARAPGAGHERGR